MKNNMDSTIKHPATEALVTKSSTSRKLTKHSPISLTFLSNENQGGKRFDTTGIFDAITCIPSFSEKCTEPFPSIDLASDDEIELDDQVGTTSKDELDRMIQQCLRKRHDPAHKSLLRSKTLRENLSSLEPDSYSQFPLFFLRSAFILGSESTER